MPHLLGCLLGEGDGQGLANGEGIGRCQHQAQVGGDQLVGFARTGRSSINQKPFRSHRVSKVILRHVGAVTLGGLLVGFGCRGFECLGSLGPTPSGSPFNRTGNLVF